MELTNRWAQKLLGRRHGSAASRERQPQVDLAVVGAGGCVLSTWLCALAPAACVTAVELSSGVADAARDCFGAATVRTPRPLCFTLSHLPPPNPIAPEMLPGPPNDVWRQT